MGELAGSVKTQIRDAALTNLVYWVNRVCTIRLAQHHTLQKESTYSLSDDPHRVDEMLSNP